MANILVVDDDPIAIQMLQDLLSHQGHQVFDAEDWSSMNDQLFQRSYALVILDVNLPGLKGDALARIVARTLAPRPKVLLHSGMDEKELRRLARRVGAIGFIAKGCGEPQLLRTVEAALAAYATETQGPTAPSAAAPAAMPATLEELVSRPPAPPAGPPKAPPPPPPLPSLSRNPGNPPRPPPPPPVAGAAGDNRPRSPLHSIPSDSDPSKS